MSSRHRCWLFWIDSSRTVWTLYPLCRTLPSKHLLALFICRCLFSLLIFRSSLNRYIYDFDFPEILQPTNFICLLTHEPLCILDLSLQAFNFRANCNFLRLELLLDFSIRFSWLLLLYLQIFQLLDLVSECFLNAIDFGFSNHYLLFSVSDGVLDFLINFSL